jgi:hypothetical protein
MTGIDIAIADPIDLTCPEDTRPAVKDLIEEHAEKIATIKAGITDHPHYDASKHDELWIVRFIMSHKKKTTKAALEAARKCIDFRAEHELDATDIRSTPPHRVETGKVSEFFERCQDDTVVLTHPHRQRGVIAFVKPASMDQHRLVAELPEGHWMPTFMYITEWSHQWLDFVTRTTGRLTRSVRFVDTDGMKLSLVNRECFKRNGKAIGAMEDFYPQLLESVFICNPPVFLKGLFTIVKAIMPKRVVEKIDMINPKERENERKRLYRHISEEDLPDKYGGKNPVPAAEWKPVS